MKEKNTYSVKSVEEHNCTIDPSKTNICKADPSDIIMILAKHESTTYFKFLKQEMMKNKKRLQNKYEIHVARQVLQKIIKYEPSDQIIYL